MLDALNDQAPPCQRSAPGCGRLPTRLLTAAVFPLALGACASSPSVDRYSATAEECLEEQQAGWVPRVADPNWSMHSAKHTPLSEAERAKLRSEAQWFVTAVKEDNSTSWAADCCLLVFINERPETPSFKGVRIRKEELPEILKAVGKKDMKSLVGMRISYTEHKNIPPLEILASEGLDCSVNAREWNANKRGWC